ncbi:hypothetical protein ACV8SR_20985 [Citrobacter freundii]|uniref:hypothetical protein n=1 Tax=Citrobacter freundii TaxID=546 RepID=UPI001160F5CD|nr:hypothetical protein [Citrobacter freundii]EKA7905901.1 hypothetical protein [Citrobacter freundii]ELK6407416.1 hypothetical protein [Citrobacter freundii]MBA8414263.1 hypothetical protein [Citrobacter freundii]MBJ8989377.1 hypothetical protein [Citrobacter freundii]QLX64880.1 hypothetical protein HV171_18365 [Citrobacter freundii]
MDTYKNVRYRVNTGYRYNSDLLAKKGKARSAHHAIRLAAVEKNYPKMLLNCYKVFPFCRLVLNWKV